MTSRSAPEVVVVIEIPRGSFLKLRDWAKKFGVSEDMLRTGVTQVGNQATDVERYLKDKAKR